MVSRPAFLEHFLVRLPDVRRLRFRVLGGVGLVAGAFGALLALAAIQLDSRRCAEVAREHAETLAQTAGTWLDGDAHAGLGSEPEKRLADLCASLEKLLEASEYPGLVRTLRPRAEVKAVLTAQPGAPRPGALVVVLQTGASAARKDVDYRAEMEDALFEGRCTSVLAGSRVLAFAPVRDSWGATTAIVCVEGPASAPLWRRAVFGAGALLFVGLLVSFVLWLARRVAERLEAQLAALDDGVRALSSGRMPEPFDLGRSAPRELAALGEALEALRVRLEAQASGQPLPAEPESAAQEERRALLGEATDFDLALLMQQLVEPARKMALARRIDLQLVFPDGLPSQLVGHPIVLYRAIDSLLRSALRTTSQGRITLRVSRAGSAAEGEKLRFEVADTSPGIAFKEQQDLSTALAGAAGADPSTLKDPLQLASALAVALGGELTFESQPGQGSRFGFTAAFQGLGPVPATAFHARAATGFHPLAASAFQPAPSVGLPPRTPPSLGPPQSSFVPRQTIVRR